MAPPRSTHRLGAMAHICFLLCSSALLMLCIFSASALSEEAELRSRLHQKLKQASLLHSFSELNMITNVHQRQYARIDLASKLTLEELNFLVEEGIFDVFVDFVVNTANNAATWVKTTANTVADGFNSKIAGPIAGWSAAAFADTASWTLYAYKKSEQDIVGFFDKVEDAYEKSEDALIKAYSESANLVKTAESYLTSGGFENDLKRLATAIDGAVKDVCLMPGVQSIMRTAISAALKAAICAATNLQAPGCKWPVPLYIDALRALRMNVIKCASFTLMEQFTGLCAGINDWIADVIGTAMASGSPAYDMAAQTIVGCICGGCPGTCSYNNRVLCNGKW